ncbi:MAG TPA: HAD family hydrolase [Candidatus Limnocylindrales bacterium]
MEAVVLDVGETLIDETRPWSWWADRLGVPRLTFFAVLGAILARGGQYAEVFQVFRPGFDLYAELTAAREERGYEPVRVTDLYPDAEPCLRELLSAGYRVAVAANQPATTEAVVRALDLPLDLVASSESWGVAKPDDAFFERIVAELGVPADRIAYVGDRLDNDVRPAVRAGMVAVFIRRGPWGWIVPGRADPPEATITINSLAELPGALAALR